MKLDVPYRIIADIPRDLLFTAKDEAHWEADDFRRSKNGLNESQSIIFRYSKSYDPAHVIDQPMLQHYSVEYAAVLDYLRRFLDIADVWASFLVRLPAGGSIKPHVDSTRYLEQIHRLHIPVITNPNCSYVIDGQTVNMEVGKIYEIDNLRMHQCINAGDTPRVHLVVNALPKPASAGTRKQRCLNDAALSLGTNSTPTRWP